MAARSKKLLKVIDGIRSWNMSTSQISPSKVCVGIDESLKCENFQVGKIAVHGFPHQPTCMAFDPIQKIVAIGTKMGVIRIFGRPGVDYVVSHPSSSAVIEIMFLINEGGIISICQDDVVHLWNIRQKNPELVHSLQFKREHLTCGHVPVASTWMYLGTDKGNVHFVNVQRFVTSGYVINWNKAIDLSQSAHPGRVVQIAESPQDPNKLLIGYSSGFLTLWDLRTKAAEARFKYSDSLNGFSWHWDGKNFLTCHNHGILATWSCKQTQRPTSVGCPHAGGDALPDDCTCYEPIHRVEWLPSKNGDPLIVFSGGSRISGYGTSPTTQTISGSSSRPEALGTADNSVGLPDTLTDPGETRDSCSPSSFMAGSRASHLSLGVKRGKRLVVMQMDYQLIQFASLCASPFVSVNLFIHVGDHMDLRAIHNQPFIFKHLQPEMMDPYAVAVLLQHDLVVVDLLSPNLAIFENPYPMDLHSSPVTACLYLVDCPGDLVPAFYSVGSRGQRQRPGPNTSASNTTTESDAFSSREWPITGGEWGLSYNPYPELVLTGHADGSVRFWDASEVTLTPLYKVRTLRFFANSNARKTESQDTRHHGTGEPANYSVDSVNGHYCPVLLDTEDDPFAVRSIQFCPDSRLLLTASSTHVCLMHFCRREQAYEIPVMDINMAYDSLDDLVLGCVPGGDAFADDQLGSGPSGTMTKESTSTSSSGRNARCMQPSGSVSSAHSGYMVDRDLRVFVPIRAGHLSWSAGYQPALICRLGIPALALDCMGTGSGSANDPTLVPPPPISAISLNSHYSLLAVGNEYGVALLDYVNRVCLLSTAISDLCGPSDLFPRPPTNRSPGRAANSSSGLPTATDQFHSQKTTSFDQNHVTHSVQPAPIANLAGYAWPLTNEAAIVTVTSGSRNKIPGDPAPDPSCCGSCDSVACPRSENLEIPPEPPSHSSPKPILTPSNLSTKTPPQAPPRLPIIPSSIHLPPWGPFTFYDLRPEAALVQMGLNWLKHAGSNTRPERTPRDQPQLVPDLECLQRVSPILTAYHPSHIVLGINAHVPKQSSMPGTGSVLTGVVHTSSPTATSGTGPLRGPAMSMDPAQSLESNLSSSVTGRCGAVSRAAAFRGELKRAKSQVVLAYKTSSVLRQQSGHDSAHAQQSFHSSGEKCMEVGPSSHSCSLSTSTSSLEQVSGEGVRTIGFMDSYARKSDPTLGPSLWIGTNRGNVLAIQLNLTDIRATQNPAHIIPSGSIFRVHGEIVHMGFLDLAGEQCPIPSNKWDESLFITRTPGPLTKQASVTSSVVSNAFENSPASSSNYRQGDSSVVARRLITGYQSSKERKPGTGVTRNSSSSTSSSSGLSGLNVSGGGHFGIHGQTSMTGATDSPSAGAAGLTEVDKQLMVICSEKQARVIALPSQTCLYKVKITETSTVFRASIQRLRSLGSIAAAGSSDNPGTNTFLGCYLANGHFVAFSLPSLRLLMDVDYLPQTECVSRSFAFGQHGQAVYLTSPSELVKITWSADVCANLRDMQGELFIPCTMPEPPRKNFFKTLLSGNLPSSVDRDELFGEEASGKSMPGTSALLPNTRMDKLAAQACTGTSEIARARNAAIERGERLGQLDLQTQEMMEQAKGFGRSAAMLAAKYEKKDKRWGWPL